MFYKIIEEKKNIWLNSKECKILDLINYIRRKNKLRDTQIQAIETYLFLKLKCENKPLNKLFSEGFFLKKYNLDALKISNISREIFKENKQALALFDFAKQNKNQKLEEQILKNTKDFDYNSVINSIFYNINYTDYLMSLPMGSGKTFLMASFIYLDLYFAENQPEDKNFAHNFLILIPSGLKNSIIPSLKTILNFDVSWIIPEPFASKLKNLISLDILDEQKSSNKSNKVVNPNALKVNNCLRDPYGKIFVVNAEKVILNKIDLENNLLFEKSEDEKSKTANELRNLIGKIPNLSILIDEVHHAATDEVKLRKVVTNWNENGNITNVLGFSGTPYLSKPEKIKIQNLELKLTQITNTVYFYPLTLAIQKFLKKPKIKTLENSNRLEIIKNGILDFNENFKNKIYNNGTIPKIAIYCSTIEVLEQEVYPFLVSELNLNPDEILKFHGGNKKYSLPKENQQEFKLLDSPFSTKKYILLVQVGKEGWDCRSLTSVILSQKGDCPQNMVLQTSCRCLRQVDENQNETAIIWLNKENADTLNNQLKLEQNTTIESLNQIKNIDNQNFIQRKSRMEYLKVPDVDFYQMEISYKSVQQEENSNTQQKLLFLIKEIESSKNIEILRESGIENIDNPLTKINNQKGNQKTSFENWIYQISQESFNTLKFDDLIKFNQELNQIFEKITYKKNNEVFFNELYDLKKINSKIRICFVIKRSLETKQEIIPKQAKLLISENLTEILNNPNLVPNKNDSEKILSFDAENTNPDLDFSEVQKAYNLMKNTLLEQGMKDLIPDYNSFIKEKEYSQNIKSKNQTFHYLPYNFGSSSSSNLEKQTFETILNLDVFKSKNLEIYYNGERNLTSFVIDCFYKKNKYWKNLGKYTTDFLIISRTENNQINKVLMIETKGSLYAKDENFINRKIFIETVFLKINKEKFGYQKFDFLYLENKLDNQNLSLLSNKINDFFN